MFEEMYHDICAGNDRALSRGISALVNEVPGSDELLQEAPLYTPVIGITGPPGAGKSSLTDRIINELIRDDSRIAVLCIDPSSPFTNGAILGDRIRMSEWYNHPLVYIRSLATRGSLGGLPRNAEKVVQLLRSAPFDYIIVETVGVGQNEVEIAALADCTIVVLVPEGGDDVQLMKAGLMEIADVYVVNKCDRPGADQFANEIKSMLRSSAINKQVIKTSASTRQGIGDLVSTIKMILEKKD